MVTPSAAAAPSISRSRFEKFAPVDTSALDLPARVTRADFDAALTRIASEKSTFSDPDALIAYIRAQQSTLPAEHLAAPVADDRVIIDDVVPRRARGEKQAAALPPEAAALPPVFQTVFAKAGLDGAQMARAAKLQLEPRPLLALLREPTGLEKNLPLERPPMPQNTVEDVLHVLEQGMGVDEMLEYHRLLVPVADQLEAREKGFTPETLWPYRKYGASVADAARLRDAGLEGGAAYSLRSSKRPVDDLLEAHRLGIKLDEYASAVGHQGNTPAELFDLWQTCDHQLFGPGAYFLGWYKAPEVKLLCESGAIDFSRGTLDSIQEELKKYREAKVSVADVARVARAGGNPNGLSSALHRNLTVDDYLKLAAVNAPDDAPTLLRFCKDVDELIRLLASGLEVKDLERSLGFFKFNVEQTLVLAKAGVDPYQAKIRYLDLGLSAAEAVAVIAAGG
ncbi:MAG: hypothetical protein IPJ65_18075 [Archangiaceae bacterium]|nr:hypothetical protein [Archangiaceae bacterium]